ncbi:TolC family protein [Aeoliella mucimassa]|uniref:Outer membrane efflux protein n=1 Tax=Aeoliella mucimassa TaxID=2527972 RepID=A0A518AUY2_9BACT|nr:TolC family protein [Aeoliella mucimassa]QDU58533.1 Outer membrane efflux protein [Aeoliella mucimassa]
MSRHTLSNISLALVFLMLATGCQPMQPFYFHEDGDLSHYVDVSTDIEYPDVEEPKLDEVSQAQRPLSVKNMDNYEVWDLSLEEATRITMCNSQVMRQLGGRVLTNAPETISRTLINSSAITTTYDPALVETGNGQSYASSFDGIGVESALAEFDAQLDSSLLWQKNDNPVNFDPSSFGSFLAQDFQQDIGNLNVGLTKKTADGSTFRLSHSTNYDSNNNGNRQTPSDWETNFEAFFDVPLFQGRGAQYNRIAGHHSFEQYSANSPNSFDGVMIARIRTDQTLADFEGGIRNLMRDVEQAYWELYFAYRDLEARKQGLESSRATWARVNQLFLNGARGGSADRKAQAEAQFFQFRAQVEEALTNLFRAESRLRYIMGLSVSDGRLIRPSDEPTMARVDFDWAATSTEAMARRVEIRKQKWQIKRRELELIAARNHLLPRLDAVGRYRWLGAGDELINHDADPAASGRFAEGTSAFESLTSGDFQEWELGLQLSVPIGYRRQLNGVRHVQLLLARERALLQDLELEVSHQLGDSIRDIDYNYQVTQTRFNGKVAAEREVQAVALSESKGIVSLDLLLDAQRRQAEAESAYYRSLVDYNLSILEVHYRKGSLLDYNGVYLAEGTWPGKAHFDALRRARQRDASMYLDYGFTRPNVMSRGPVSQSLGTPQGMPYEGEVMEGPMMYEGEFQGEEVPMSEPTPAAPQDEWGASDTGASLQPAGAVQPAGYPSTASSPERVSQASYQMPAPQASITYATAQPATTQPTKTPQPMTGRSDEGQTHYPTTATPQNPGTGWNAQR